MSLFNRGILIVLLFISIDLFDLFFFTKTLGELFGKEPFYLSPLKVEIETKRSFNFLKILVYCKNESISETTIKLRLNVCCHSTEKNNVSKVLQVKNLKLGPLETQIPFIIEFMVKPEDIYEINLEIFDVQGRLIFKKTVFSETV